MGKIVVPMLPLLLLLLLHLGSGVSGAEFLPPGQVVAGKNHTFICQSINKKPIIDCKFGVPGFEEEIKMIYNVKNPRYGSAGEGFQKGECGISLRPVYRNNTGQFKCRLTLDDMSKHVNNIQVDVLYPVAGVGINSNSNGNDYEYYEKKEMQINCTADGNPQPNITMFIDGVKVRETQGSTLIFETLAKPEYHNKDLKCEAEQSQLNHTIADNRTLTVQYGPRPRLMSNGSTEMADQKEFVLFEFMGNPKPNYTLTQNGEMLRDMIKEFWCSTEHGMICLNVTLTPGCNYSLQLRNEYGNFTVPIQSENKNDWSDWLIKYWWALALALAAVIVGVIIIICWKNDWHI